jgi:hypothetical protein
MTETPIVKKCLTSLRAVAISVTMLTVVSFASHPTPTTEIGGWVASTRWRQIRSMCDVEVSRKSGQAVRPQATPTH